VDRWREESFLLGSLLSANEARPRSGRVNRRGVLSLILVATLLGGIPRAARAQGRAAFAADRNDNRTRAEWAALLLGYAVVGSLVTGGAYLLRDSVFGRSVAVGAATWGGTGVGAGAGYGLANLKGCAGAMENCSAEEGGAVYGGAALGAIVGSLAGYFSTRKAGMSRPYTTAAGFAPALIFLSVGTLIDW
jgi:hypothetical protein